LRLAVYSDDGYRRDGDEVWAQEAVVLFLVGLARWVDSVTLVGRLEPEPGRWAYKVPNSVGFVALPHYPSLALPRQALGVFASSLRRFWRAIDEVDTVWLLGPHPFAIAFALVARARGRVVALGVRQDFPAYVSNRHPRSRALRLEAIVLEGAWRALARAFRVVVVGRDLAQRYKKAPRMLDTPISLIREDEIAGADVLEGRDYSGRIDLLSVGRLAGEKNPLLLADVLERLVTGGGDWQLTVVGEGPLAGPLRERADRLGVGRRIDLVGYQGLEEGLLERYRASHVLLHCAWTEGVPQVLLEAFGARLPVVATAVGGVPTAAENAAELIPPGDADAASEAVRRLIADPDLRARHTAEGADRARASSLESTTQSVASFLARGQSDAR